MFFARGFFAAKYSIVRLSLENSRKLQFTICYLPMTFQFNSFSFSSKKKKQSLKTINFLAFKLIRNFQKIFNKNSIFHTKRIVRNQIFTEIWPHRLVLAILTICGSSTIDVDS